jgi:hypothetical protein
MQELAAGPRYSAVKAPLASAGTGRGRHSRASAQRQQAVSVSALPCYRFGEPALRVVRDVSAGMLAGDFVTCGDIFTICLVLIVEKVLS